MAILGIIAEFNPFHNGHLHLLQEIRKAEPCSAIICVMSGNFLQRGEPAVCNKWARSAMALRAGADLIIELPFCFAVRSAYYFARGAIQLLQRTGVVTHLAFGSESGQLSELQAIAHYLGNESQDYKKQLKEQLARGLSFASARSLALQSILPDNDLQNLLIQPNNILAIEYLRVLEEEQVPIKPLTILREGSEYHSTELGPLASASAIRLSLQNNQNLAAIATAIPPDSLVCLEQEIAGGRAPVTIDALEQSIIIKLRTTSSRNLADIYEITEGLENRIIQGAMQAGTLEELKLYIKSKRYSLSRINRILLYALFDIHFSQMASFDKYGPQYLHVLGFSTHGRKILQEIKNKSSLRILSRGSAVKESLADNSNPVLQSMLDLDVRAANVYTLLYPNPATRKGAQDFITSPVRLPQ